MSVRKGVTARDGSISVHAVKDSTNTPTGDIPSNMSARKQVTARDGSISLHAASTNTKPTQAQSTVNQSNIEEWGLELANSETIKRSRGNLNEACVEQVTSDTMVPSAGSMLQPDLVVTAPVESVIVESCDTDSAAKVHGDTDSECNLNNRSNRKTPTGSKTISRNGKSFETSLPPRILMTSRTMAYSIHQPSATHKSGVLIDDSSNFCQAPAASNEYYDKIHVDSSCPAELIKSTHKWSDDSLSLNKADSASVQSTGSNPRFSPDLQSASKSKKKVCFQPEEYLVQVLEISPRMESPLSQELAPCDPVKLWLDNELDMRQFTAHRPHHRAAGTGGVSGHSAVRLSRRPPQRVQSAGARSSQGPNIKYKDPNQPQVKVLGQSDRLLDSRMSGKRYTPHTNQRMTSYYSEQTSIVNWLRNQNTGSNPKTRNSSFRSPAGYNSSQQSALKTRTPHKSSLLSADSPYQGDSGLYLQINGDSIQSRQQLHQSPYRQGSASNPRSLGSIRKEASSTSFAVNRAHVESDRFRSLGGRVIGDGSQLDGSHLEGGPRPRRSFSAPAASPRRLQSWQRANDTRGEVEVDKSGPCIIQLWNSPAPSQESVHTNLYS